MFSAEKYFHEKQVSRARTFRDFLCSFAQWLDNAEHVIKNLTSAYIETIMYTSTLFRRIVMLFRQKKRWICKELERYLLSLHPVFFISVKRCVNGTTAYFPFRDDDGKLLIDVYDCDAVCIDMDYMKTGFPVETIYVGKDGIESRRFPYIKEKLDKYVSKFPKTSWNTSVEQLAEMHE